MKPKLLFLSAHLPSEDYPQAGHKIAYHNLFEMSKNYEVHLISFANKKEFKYYKYDNYKFCVSQKIFYLSNFRRFINLLNNIFLPYKIAIRQDKRVYNYLKSKKSFLHIHFEYTEVSGYLNYFNNIQQFSVTAHDIIYQSLERKYLNRKFFLSKAILNFEWKRQLKWETDIYRKNNQIIVLCSKDKKLLLENNIDEKKIKIDPPLINEKFKNINRNNIEKNSILFVGAMDRIENTDAMIWFVKKVIPLLEKKKFNYKLYIVGANPPLKIKQYSNDKIIVTGFVDNIIKFYEKCHIVIAPLREGAGIKIKVLEALSCGIKVIASPVAAESIENDNLLIAKDENEFATKIIETVYIN